MLDPIITMNAGGVIQSASDSVTQVFGWTPTELLGRNVKVLIPEPRRSALDRYLDRYRKAEPSKPQYRTSQFNARRKDGSMLRIELSVSKVDLPAQSSCYFIGIVRDISRHIDTSANGAAERTRLQQFVTEQTRALATATLRLHLADRLASIGSLAAGLGHDLNNVLLPVRARLNAIEHSGLPASGLKHLAAIRQSISYLQHLSDGFHFLALDPDAESADAESGGATDLHRWWDQVGELLRRALPKRVSLRVSIPATLPLVAMSSHWLTQAMLNLIINAGESITPRRKGRVRIWAELSDDGIAVRLAITDNGCGMTRGVLRRAFDLFFTTKSRSLGTGLGLPLARKIALRAGGDVELSSTPGGGTTATVVLQVAARPGQNSKRANSPRTLAAVSLTNVRTSAMISQVLVRRGFDVSAAARSGPRNASIWVTNPSPRLLPLARAWRKRVALGSLVLLGAPPVRFASAWAPLAPTIVDSPDDLEAVLHIVRELTPSPNAPRPRGARSRS